jgi:hypothetical protein
MSGFHYINRIGYFVTENPCTQEYMEIQVDIYEEEEEEEENA